MPKLYATESQNDPMVQVKYFTPDSNWTWYAWEFQEVDGEGMFFGYVEGFEGELGYFSLSELQEARGPMGLRIERDLFFKPTSYSQIRAQ